MLNRLLLPHLRPREAEPGHGKTMRGVSADCTCTCTPNHPTTQANTWHRLHGGVLACGLIAMLACLRPHCHACLRPHCHACLRPHCHACLLAASLPCLLACGLIAMLACLRSHCHACLLLQDRWPRLQLLGLQLLCDLALWKPHRLGEVSLARGLAFG